MEYDWKTDEYVNLVEKTNNPFLRDFIDKELQFLCAIEKLDEKSLVDVGAGYGRVIPILSPMVNNFYAVELDKKMIEGLKKTVDNYINCSIVECDAQELRSGLEGLDIKKPIVMSLQNSLGTPYGNPYKIIDEMVRYAKEKRGEIVVSFFTQESLQNCGVPIYTSLVGLVGEIDLTRTDFERGDFIAKSGYKSHWFTEKEREMIKELIGGMIISELKGNCFHIIHSKY